MKMGTRWPLGHPAPAGLPHVVEIAIRAVEDELTAVAEDSRTWRWTLTWLEGSPVLELDDGTIIRYDKAEDSATITQPSIVLDDEDDWI